ncbi:SHOCT domain-containing protein [Lacipirellula limnantheis]|uniref:SHOCT domain-containing protein n=1 Tax=Lacipirellula limnantheis TaxID=2528024 RepID=UPI001AEFB899|nr:SHOCT domain-containing protein [Lacipirellula limnantheis]
MSRDGQPVQASHPPASPHVGFPGKSSGNAPLAGDVFAALERLGELRHKGIVTDDEFNQKKGDLLSRL